jgi:hypothetical protein
VQILILVITSSSNQERIKIINSTWNIEHKNIETIFVSDTEDIDSKILKLSNFSDYKSAEEKALNILKLLKIKNDRNWYFIVDDDTFVNYQNLIEYTRTADPEYVHGYMAHKEWWNGLEYLQGGAGTLISKQVVEKIQENTIIHYNTGFSDVALGLVFKANNIKIKGCNQSDDCLFLEKPFSHYSYIEKTKLLKKITFHQIRTYDDMKEIMNFYGA